MSAEEDLERTEARIRELTDEIISMTRAIRQRTDAMVELARQYRAKWSG